MQKIKQNDMARELKYIHEVCKLKFSPRYNKTNETIHIKVNGVTTSHICMLNKVIPHNRVFKFFPNRYRDES